MDKTISISLGGYSFIIDEPAYLKLKKYLDDIRRSLKGMEGTDDVISDVEIRIAELFKEKLGNREVVSEPEVDQIIGIMGKPEQYMDDEDAEIGSERKTGFTSGAATAGKKKLYRDPDDKVLGGVLSGIAHYIGIESWITRVIWILLFFADIPLTGTSFTIISYIILWIILPKAETVTQKYEMFGETGDIESIKRSVESGAETGKKRHNPSDSFADALKIFGKMILVFLGFICICIGFSLVFAAIFTLIATAGNVPVQFFGRIFDFQWQDTLMKVLLLIMLGVPGVLFTYLGARMISSRVKINRILIFSMLGLWLLSIIGVSILGVTTVKSFSKEVEFTERKSFTPEQDTIALSLNKFKLVKNKKIKWGLNFDTDLFAEMDGKFYRKIDNEVELRLSPNDQLYVDVVYFSRGSSIDDARQNSEKIVYNYTMNSDGELVLDNYLELPAGSKFRDQEVSVILYVPNGKVIHSTNVSNLIFSDEDSERKIYRKGNNKFYKFVDGDFECLNCNNNSTESDDDDDDSDTANISIGRKGIRVKDGDSKVEISNKKINITDGTDTINIGGSGD